MKDLLKRPTTLFIGVGFVILISLFLRTYLIGHPAEKVFDEVYFPVFAHNYLTGKDFFDAHPPLGKLIIASGISIFGDNPFGWRIMNALTGILLLAIAYGFTLDLTKKPRAALLVLTLFAIDPMLLVESRIGLINIYLAFFSLTGLWFFWRWWTQAKFSFLNFTLMAISLGAAIAVKWIGIGALAAILFFVLISLVISLTSQRKLKLPPLHLLHIALLLLIPLVYLASFIPDLLRGQDIIWWHTSTYGYHAHLNATHPYGSAWWTWPLVLRPVWLYFKTQPDGAIQGIIEIGNLVTWLGGLIVLLYSILTLRERKEDSRDPILFLLICYMMLYIPWALISRVKFIYHYFVPCLILLILCGIMLDEKIFSFRERRWIGLAFLALGFAFFLYFLPLLLGTPISEPHYRNHLWIRSWI